MKDFYAMTLGEIIKMKDDDIEKMAPVVGKEFVDNNLEKVQLFYGKKIIKGQIKKLKELMEVET